MTVQHWLVKQEPSDYSWARFLKDGEAAWTGVRNFQARNHLRAMRKGDWVLFYHSGEDKQVVGIAQVKREAYGDPTAANGDWSCVDLVPERPLVRHVRLEVIKNEPLLKDLALVRQSRLSVMPVSAEEFARILELGATRL